MKPMLRWTLAITLALQGALFARQVLAHEAEGAVNAMSGQSEETPFGHPGKPDKVTRTIEVQLRDDMRFAPGVIRVKRGQTVRFRIRNTGQVDHEFVLGDKADIQSHADMMKQMPGMTHNDANMLRVAPGKSGEVIWAFTKPGKFLYACLVPGHWEAGMQGTVEVTAAPGEAK